MADFTVKTPAIDPAAFANVLQRKQQIENEQQRYEQERKDNRLKRITDAIIAGQTIASNMLTISDKRGELKKKRSEAEGRQETLDILKSPLIGADFAEPSLDPKVNAQMFEAAKAERRKALEAAVAKGNYDEYSKAFFRNQFETANAGDTDIRSLEFNDGTVKDVIVNKKTKTVHDLAGNLLDKDTLEQTVRGYAPKIVEDLEGRKAKVSGGGKVKGLFGESEAPDSGKETRVQFTPEERKSIIASRNELDSHEYIKKFKGVAPDIALLEDLIEKNPKGAIGPVRTQISKQVAGEVGRLTDEDIARNVPTPDLIPKAQQWLRSIKDGDFTDITRERYGILLEIVQKKRAEEAGRILDDVVNNTTDFELSGSNKEAVRKAIGRGLVPFIDKYKPKESFSTPEDLKAASTDDLKKRLEKLKVENK